MKYAFITSMDEKYYHRCGRRMIHSFEQYWYPSYKLNVYNENFDIIENCVNNLGWDLGEEYIRFQNTTKNQREKTFSKKAFSIIHAMENIDCDRLVWLDADLRINNKIKESFLDELLPQDKLSLHFGVWHSKNDKKYFSCETGFFILNKKHTQFENFKQVYKNIYVNKDRDNLRRFYDGEVYGKTVLQFDQDIMVDLNLNKKYKTPIGKSILRHYISHLKAGLKDKLNEI